PGLLLLFPVERRLPALPATSLPAVGQPKLGPLVTARFDERQVFPVGNQAGSQPKSWLPDLMPRCFVVKSEAVAVVPLAVEAFREGNPVRRAHRCRNGLARSFPVGRPERVGGEGVLDIG